MNGLWRNIALLSKPSRPNSCDRSKFNNNWVLIGCKEFVESYHLYTERDALSDFKKWKKNIKLYNSNNSNAYLHTSAQILENYTCTSNERPRVSRKMRNPERPPQRQNEVQCTMGQNNLWSYIHILDIF